MKEFRTLKKDFLENRWRILIGLLALFIVDILQLFIPRVVKHAIDDLTWEASPLSASFCMEERFSFLLWESAGFVMSGGTSFWGLPVGWKRH